MTLKLASALVGVLLSGLAACTQVAVLALNSITTSEFRVDGERLYLSGEINSKTLEQFKAVIAANPRIKTLVELDVPGSVDDDTMIALAYRVRELGLNTHLTANSVIQSGGVDLFLAGIRRTMEPGARIGVHSWSDGSRDAWEYRRDDSVHEQNRRYIENMLGDDAFYWFTIYAATADDIHMMSEAEIRKYGLLTE
ncbi:alpha/beta hydrolase [uncultured Roseovarius sp.]|uniref:COG3904 family protein n=1 Tax=uncultured Roseovarius sp. TaxID=293344 RepID=UPI00260FBAF8|nr:alpha/beta hydrolase [uncultured Roseovarius sp.]